MSHRVIPNSTACLKKGADSSSDSDHSLKPRWSPKLMQPRAILLTVNPDEPRRVYSMVIPFLRRDPILVRHNHA
ncbi:hypothetical protein ACSDQ9_04410 [Aestuariimicrobium soli]|uniref:hypothetical protein n=1 Tax=Aestuariimicrobium soli TaxID=2035834 RepID=UPI003EBAF61F